MASAEAARIDRLRVSSAVEWLLGAASSSDIVRRSAARRGGLTCALGRQADGYGLRKTDGTVSWTAERRQIMLSFEPRARCRHSQT